MRYVRVVGWEEAQNFAGKLPPWIRFYSGLLDEYRWGKLEDGAKAHYVGLCLLASRTGNLIEADAEWVARRIQATGPVDLEPLIALGFLERCDGPPEAVPEAEIDTPKTAQKAPQKTGAKKAPKKRVSCARKTQSKRKVASGSRESAKALLKGFLSEESREEENREDQIKREEDSENAKSSPADGREMDGKEAKAGPFPPPAIFDPQPPHSAPLPVAARGSRPPPPFATPQEPTCAELAAHARSLGYADFNPEAFLARYRAVGWKQGGDRIADWRPLVRRWQLAERGRPRTRGSGAFAVGKRLIAMAGAGGEP